MYLYLSSRSYIVADLDLHLGVSTVLSPMCLRRGQNPQESGTKKIKYIRRTFLAQALGGQLVTQELEERGTAWSAQGSSQASPSAAETGDS